MYTFYRGTNFQFTGTVQNNGIAQDLTGASIQASVYDPTATINYATLTCTITGDPKAGLLSVSYSGNTIAWPVGLAKIFFLLNLPNNSKPIAADPVEFRIAQTPLIG